MVKIAGCAGHGGFGVTPGKRTPDGEYEWDFNNKAILSFEETLKQYENVEFLRTDDRTGRTDVPLATRTNTANSWGADLYVSFHENANTGKWGSWGGTETLTYGSGKSLEMGKAIHAAQLKAYGLRDRGVKNGSDLWIIRKTNMPAVLLEGAFMDSTTDITKLRDNNVLRKAGCEVAHAVAKYFGLKKKITPQPVSTNQPTVAYEAHVEGIGWQGVKRNGETAGTVGQSKRLEALSVRLENSNAQLKMEGHIQNKGWTSLRTNGEIIGTTGEGLRLEAVKLACEGFNISYRVHQQNIGWTDWKKNGEEAGTTGQALRIEAIEIKLA